MSISAITAAAPALALRAEMTAPTAQPAAQDNAEAKRTDAPEAGMLCASAIAARAVYDCRTAGLEADPTFDRLDMIKTGFDHIKEIFATIRESGEAEAGQELNTSM